MQLAIYVYLQNEYTCVILQRIGPCYAMSLYLKDEKLNASNIHIYIHTYKNR